MNHELLDLKRKQIDTKLRIFQQKEVPKVPSGGWVKAIRTALGMSTDALGKRVGITQSAVHQLEASEKADTITLSSLKKLAGGLECDVVYALVPKMSLDESVKRQALVKARTMILAIASSMALEKQAISSQEQDRQIKAAATKLIVNPGTGFWD